MTIWINPADDPEIVWDEAGLVRAKWTIEGATTLAEAAAMLRAEADSFEAMELAGYQLREPVADDYGFLEKA